VGAAVVPVGFSATCRDLVAARFVAGPSEFRHARIVLQRVLALGLHVRDRLDRVAELFQAVGGEAASQAAAPACADVHEPGDGPRRRSAGSGIATGAVVGHAASDPASPHSASLLRGVPEVWQTRMPP
jgi:hypothetical protein